MTNDNNNQEAIVKNSRYSSERKAGVLITVASVIVILFGLKAAKPVLIPFLLAIFISIACYPLLSLMRRFKIPDLISVFAIILGICITGFIVIAIISTSVDDFNKALPIYQQKINNNYDDLMVWLANYNIHIGTSKEMLLKHFNAGKLFKFLTNTLSGVGNVLTNLFLILLIVIFILLEASTFPVKFKEAFSDRKNSLDNFDAIARGIKQYLGVKTIISFITGILVSVFLSIIGVDYAIMFGLLAFMFNYVPNIGSLMASFPAILIAAIQLGFSAALKTAFCYLIVNIVMGNFIEPKIMGEKVGLSTTVVFASLLCWGNLLGPVGMLLSVPLTMTIKIACNANKSTRWISTFLNSPSGR